MKKLIMLNTFALMLVSASAAMACQNEYPWENNCGQYPCAYLKQDDGKHIGSVCVSYDYELQITKLNMYYFGELMDANPKVVYANLYLEGFGDVYERGMKRQTFVQYNKKDAYFYSLITTNAFAPLIKGGRNFAVDFGAEDDTKPDHLTHDNLFGRRYTGRINGNW